MTKVLLTYATADHSDAAQFRTVLETSGFVVKLVGDVYLSHDMNQLSGVVQNAILEADMVIALVSTTWLRTKISQAETLLSARLNKLTIVSLSEHIAPWQLKQVLIIVPEVKQVSLHLKGPERFVSVAGELSMGLDQQLASKSGVRRNGEFSQAWALQDEPYRSLEWPFGRNSPLPDGSLRAHSGRAGGGRIRWSDAPFEFSLEEMALAEIARPIAPPARYRSLRPTQLYSSVVALVPLALLLAHFSSQKSEVWDAISNWFRSAWESVTPATSLFLIPWLPKRKDWVEATVFAPASCEPHSTATIQAFVHKPEAMSRKEVAEFSSRIDQSASFKGRQGLKDQLQHGDEVSFILSAPHPETQYAFRLERPRIASIVWRGFSDAVNFVCETRADCLCRKHKLILTVIKNKLPIGELEFVIEIEKREEADQRTTLTKAGNVVTSLPSTNDGFYFFPSILDDAPFPNLAPMSSIQYRQIFVSYSRADLEDVRKVVRAFSISGQRYFMDTEGLRPGEEWKAVLREQIEAADLVVLFWSENARNSEMVRYEIEHALKVESERGRPSLYPFPLDGPPPPPPWDIIAHRHIGDPIYYGFAQRN